MITDIQRRSDGARTHAAILEAAMQVASIEGLEGLTIGRLAGELGVSKSGVYAHFGSKEQLQVETIEAAQRVHEREVIAPALAAPPGLTRLRAFCDAQLSYVERLIFPGGCFFAALLAEMDARTGPLHDMAQAGARQWLGMIAGMVEEAQGTGEIALEVDPRQLAFELDAALELANYYYVLLRDPLVIARARRAVESALGRAAS